MAYCTIADVKNVLLESLYTYGANVDDQIAFAESEIDSILGGVYALPFDDASLYASVPVQIEWAAALLAAFKCWDEVVPLEGQKDDTAAARWRKMALDRLTQIAEGDARLTLADGTVVTDLSTTAPRFYPGGVKEKADEGDNTPMFTRAQAGEW